jgi:hypothetical protein
VYDTIGILVVPNRPLSNLTPSFRPKLYDGELSSNQLLAVANAVGDAGDEY